MVCTDIDLSIGHGSRMHHKRPGKCLDSRNYCDNAGRFDL